MPCELRCLGSSNVEWLFKIDSLGEPAKRKVVTNVEEEIVISNAVRLFPNPTSGILTVEFDRADYFTSIEIVDINGIFFVVYTLDLISSTEQTLISQLFQWVIISVVCGCSHLRLPARLCCRNEDLRIKKRNF